MTFSKLNFTSSVLVFMVCIAAGCAPKATTTSTTLPPPAIPETPISDTTQIYRVVEQMPQFPGGEQNMMTFISQNMHYPAQAKDNKEEGMVVIQFVVTDKGDLINPKIMRSASPSLDQEALRILSLMPQWTPGKQNGRPVYVYYMLPFRFRLN